MSAQKQLVKTAWLAGLAGTLIFLAASTAGQLAAIRAATALGETGRPAPAYDAASPTGYAGGRRDQILASTDGYHWVMQTQQMIARGEWRIRRVDYDNAPDGREVHWSSPLHWWLALVAWGDHALTGRPLLPAVESAARYAGPLLLGLLLLGIVPWTVRRFGALPGVLLAAGLVTVVPFTAEYGTGSYDHHGVAASCALLTVLFLLAGCIGPPEQARRAFVASGFAGAAGLWVNAASQVPVLIGIGLGVLLALAVNRREKSPPINPALWRTWGLAGGAVSLLFYLVEYFPAHCGWRLEVNHPLYALAWAGAGDWLARLADRGPGRPPWRGGRDGLAALAGLIAIGVIPLLMKLAPLGTFVVADRFLWTLHVDYISEFAPFPSWLHDTGGGLETWLLRLNVLPLIGVAALGLLARDALSPAHRATLALSLPPALLTGLLAWSQVRWLHLAAALWLVVLVATAHVAITAANFTWTRGRVLVAGLFLTAVLLPYPVRTALDLSHDRTGLSRENVRQFVMRDLAFWLRRRTGIEPVILLSAPTTTTELVYHGGFKGVGTLYWENRAGLRSLVDIFGAANPAAALALLRARGVTHLVILPWGSFASESARLARGLRADAPAPAGGFALDLLGSGRGLPDWVRPLPYRLPATEVFKEQFALVLEIAPAQSAADAAARRAQFLAAMGDEDAARDLVRQVVAENPDEFLALLVQAQLQRAARLRAAHAATVAHLRAVLPRDPAWETGDRVALALELAAAGYAAEAHAQLARCWADTGDRDLRRLAPDSLASLLLLTRNLQVSAPPDLLALAQQLGAADHPPEK